MARDAAVKAMEATSAWRWIASLGTAGLLLITAAAAAGPKALGGTRQQDRACAVTTAPGPRPATLTGCSQAWCAGEKSDALCVCEQPPGDGDRRRHAYRLLGTPTLSWPTEVSPMFGAEGFSVLHADLDGDGVPDRIVEQRQAQSNGMGVAYAKVCVWPSSSKSGLPHCRETEDWGFLTRLVQEPGRQACSLVDGRWQPGREAGRGDGLYAVGRTWRLDASGWKPAAGRPVMSRRYLKSFERERDAAATSADAPLWYQSAQARKGR